MNYFIDAWLDCENPRLRILNKITGETCLTLYKEDILYLQEQSILDVSSLYSSSHDVIQEISIELLNFEKLS